MLITNFAAGELSETLFGRTDIPQYFQGVSWLENFDVIPTGGISRRNGTKRIDRLSGHLSDDDSGRLIPFLVDRENSLLLYFTLDDILVYKNGVFIQKYADYMEPMQPAGGYYTAEEIREIQYAQNFNKLILVHKNHPPICIMINSDSEVTEIYIDPIDVTIDIENVYKTEENGFSSDEYDKEYRENHYLVGSGNYPSCVSFFQGRLVFGGTNKHPQRLFFSRVNQNSANNSSANNSVEYNFSTYKKFITKVREYITVSGTVLPDKKFQLRSRDEVYKFSNEVTIDNYIVDYAGYPLNTKVAAIDRNTNIITFSAEYERLIGLTQEERRELNTKINDYNNKNSMIARSKKILSFTIYHYTEPPTYDGYTVYLHYGVSQWKYVIEGKIPGERNVEFGHYMLRFSKQNLINNIKGNIDEILGGHSDVRSVQIYDVFISEIVDIVYDDIRSLMYHTFRGTACNPNDPKDPAVILQDLINTYGELDEIFLPLYFKKTS